MSSQTRIPAQSDEDILFFDIPDDVLERAAGAADGHAITWAFCTDWYHCRWPT